MDHPALLAKLNILGINSTILNWMSSYLSFRFQYVVINSTSFYKFILFSGVPQGIHLGPLSFLLFINDLPKVIKYSKFLLFADNLKIYWSISNLNNYFLLQLDINAVVNWCELNKLQLNIKKNVNFLRSTEHLLVFCLTMRSKLSFLIDPNLSKILAWF